MTALPASPARPVVELDVKIAEALAAVALLPAGTQGAFRERIYDLLSHHRLSVLRHHGLPGGRPAQQMLATRLYRYTRAETKGGRIVELVGEGFAAAESGEIFARGNLALLEHGGTVSSGQPMAIPTGQGRGQFGGGLRTHGNFASLLRSRGLDVSPSGALFTSTARGGLRTVLWGVLRRSRRQRPVLGYYRQFEDVQRRHVSKFERDLELAMTASGRIALEERAKEKAHRRAVYVATLRKYLEAHPGRLAEANRVAGLAAKAARAQGITRPGMKA